MISRTTDYWWQIQRGPDSPTFDSRGKSIRQQKLKRLFFFRSPSILTWPDASRSSWSYSLNATQKMMDVTDSKQWIHFLRSDLCPPTSNILYGTKSKISCEPLFSRFYRLPDRPWSILIHPVPCLAQTYCIFNCPIVKRVSMIPVVFWRARKTSWTVGI